MKKLLILITLLYLAIGTYAQFSKTIDIATAGTLSTVLTPAELQNVTNLTVRGTIDARDFKTMRDDMPVLAALDLGTVTIAAYEGLATYHLGDVYRANAIPQYAFYHNYKLTSIVLPLSVTSIEYYAFLNCITLISVTFPSSGTSVFTSIGNSAFFGCNALTTFSIPSTVSSIGDEAFKGCEALTSVTIPSSLTSINSYAFCGCSKLTSITIPSSVISIGSSAFYGCVGLTSVTIGSSVTYISHDAFEECNKIIITVDENNPNFSSLDDVLYNKAKTTLIKFPISKTGSFTIPSTVISIPDYAFSGCVGLTSVIIPSSVNSIGYAAFSGCYRLNSVNIPSSVNSIGAVAFSGCIGLTTVTIPSSITLIDGETFNRCSGLTSVYIPASINSIGNSAFSGSGDLIVDEDNPNYSSLEGVLYNKAKTILIHFPISKNGSFTIPSTVISIPDYAFYECVGLTSVTIPSSVTSIGYQAFSGCTELTMVTALNPMPVYFPENFWVFSFVKSTTCILNVPYGSKGAYQTSWDWSNFKDIVEMPGLKLSASTANLKESQGSTATIDISSNVPWSASSDQSWLIVSPTNGNGIHTITFTATENQNNTTRTATVMVLADGIESQIITVTQDAITEIDPVVKKQDFAFYPNPTSGRIKLVFDNIIPRSTYLEVKDVAGKLILKQTIQNQEEWIDLKGNVPGVYLIKTNLKNFQVQKVILR